LFPSFPRAIILYLAIRELKYPVTDVAKILHISAPSVSQRIQRGKVLLGEGLLIANKLAAPPTRRRNNGFKDR